LSEARFITLEGGEGGGKSTQVFRLMERLRRAGLQVVATREPGGAEGAEVIRRLLLEGEPGRWDAMTELLLHYAARQDHLRRTIRPALKRGQWVVCDRFADSTMAYQGYGHKLGREIVEAVHGAVVGTFKPDLTLILDLPVEDGLGRTEARGDQNRYERMDKEFHQRLRQGFLEIARREPERCVVIDATQSSDAVTEAVAAAVRSRLSVAV
jgi:dTMP kinase